MPLGPKRWQRGSPLTAAHLQSVNKDTVQRTSGPSGVRASRHGGSQLIEVDQAIPYRPWILAKITGWALIDGEDTRWVYAWSEVELNAKAFVVKSGGRTGTTSSGYALNRTEANNIAQGTGIQGNSVDDSPGGAYPGNFSLQPVGGGTGGVPGNEVVVQLWATNDQSDGSTAYVFEYQNSDDGTC